MNNSIAEFIKAKRKQLKINDKSLHSIYVRFEKILPTWIAFIDQSFLSQKYKENYTEMIIKKHKKLFEKFI
jgi:hypothetical protein